MVIELGDEMYVSRLIRSEEGSAFAMVLVAMAVVFLLVTGLIVVSVSENTHAMYQVNEAKAYYIARAGAEAMVKELKRMDPSDLTQFSTAKTATASTNVLNNTGTISVTVERIGSSADFRIVSSGNFSGHTEEVSIIMSFEDVYDIDYAAYSELNMTNTPPSSGNVGIKDVYGDLASGGDILYNESSGGVTGSVIRFTPLVIDILDMDISSITITSDLTEVDLSGLGNNDDFTIDSSSYVHDMDLGNNNTITIDTTNADYKREEGDTSFVMTHDTSAADPWMIVYLQGHAESTGDINVIGDHNLMLIIEESFEYSGNNADFTMPDDIFVKWYVMDRGDATKDISNPELTLEGNTTGVTDHPEQFEIFIYGENTVFDYSNGAEMYGKIYAEGGTVLMKNGTSMLHGSVFGQNVYLAASTSIDYVESTTTVYSIGKRMDVDHWEE